MKTLEQRYRGENILHSDKTPQEVLRAQYSDTCFLRPRPVLHSTRPGMDYCKTYSIMDREGCEKGDENWTGAALVEIP